ncbi:hypothetical protein H5410_056367 [Solanum commersonii]|uniref:Uncharacterized protein n=1 Tax=Solanum commersonii TaxID=4109 RepID=A0A9J5WK22_SOLCO|nr:hypothetical protein H5410_056367 [Solanum commersonii]
MAFRKSSDFSYKGSTGVVSTHLSHFSPISRCNFKNNRLDGSKYFTYLEMMKNNNSHRMVVTATPRGNLASVFFGEFSQISSNFGESEDSMDSPTSMNSKFQNEKQSASVALLSVQQLQDMITITIRAQYGEPNQKKCSRSTFLQFGSLTPILVDFPRKTLEGSLEIDTNEENEVDGWTLVTHKKRRHQAVLSIRLPKTRAKGVTSQIGATNVISISDEIKENKDDDLMLGSKLHNRPLFVVGSIREHPNRIQLDVGSTVNIMQKVAYVEADSIDLEDSKVQWAASKKGQLMLEECTQQFHPPRKEFTHIAFHDLKEKMIVLVPQVSSIALEHSKGNTQISKIKGNFDQKVFTLFEKPSYDFSNPAKLGELRDEVTSEIIHGLTKSQMQLRKKGYHVAIHRFGLGFSLPEPLRISSKKGKEIASSHKTTIEKIGESKEGKTPRRILVFERIGRLTPRVSSFERLGRKDERESSKQVDGYASTSKTSVFHRSELKGSHHHNGGRWSITIKIFFM